MEKGVLRDSGRMMGAEEKGVVRIQWDKGEMWGHSGRGGLERVSLALAVGRNYMRSVGEEGVMSRSVSRGTLLLRGGQDAPAADLPRTLVPYFHTIHWKWHQRT